jgi:rubredoxin-NAD+ reductase
VPLLPAKASSPPLVFHYSLFIIHYPLSTMHPITIIGSGLAGYTVARELRKLDKNLPLRLLTAEDGHFYSKPTLSNAFAQHKTPETLITTSVIQMAEQLHAEIITQTQVTQLTPQQHTLSAAEKTYQYSQLVLACGADPIRLPMTGTATDQVLSINTLTDYTRFRNALQHAKHITILGAGLIGCEFANDLQPAGFNVTVIDPTTHPLGRLVPKIAGEALQQALQKLGVTWQLGKTVTRVDHAKTGYHLTLSDDSTLTTDVILSAIGLRPRTDLAVVSGITVERGIIVNRYLKTNTDDIYALGDCAQVEGLVLPFVMPLMNAARALAKTLAGQPTAVTYPAMPVVVKTPACPLIVSPPAANLQGEWEIEAAGQDIRALFYTPTRQLGGMVLTGAKVGEKTTWTKLLPPILGENSAN